MPSRNAFEKKALVIAIAISFGGTSIAARADTLEDLKEQIETLKKKMLELEQKQQTTEKTPTEAVKNVVTAGATKGSFKLPGSNTSVTLGGYVKLDAVYSNPSAGTGTTADLFLQPNAIAVGPGAGDNERNQLKFGARESRMFAKTNTPTSWGDLVTYIEGDFYGADGNESVSNSSGLRLRHAYGTVGHFLGGQTWTNFMYVPALPETLDFGGPVGQIFDRQAQVRWTQSFDGSAAIAAGQWSVSLENPESVVTVPGGPMSAFDRHIGHRRHFSPDDLRAVLLAAGFQVERTTGVGFPFFNLYRLVAIHQRQVEGQAFSPLFQNDFHNLPRFGWLDFD